MFRGTPLELSQSHFDCVTCPEDPKPLASSRDPGPVRSLRLFLFFLLSSDLGGLGLFLSSFVTSPFYTGRGSCFLTENFLYPLFTFSVTPINNYQ